MSKKITLTRYLIEQQRMDGHIPPERSGGARLQKPSQAVNNGALGGVLGTAGSENVQGEVQKKLDIIAAWAATSVAPMIPRQVIN